MAGFTTVRDVGSSDYIDVGLRNAIRAGFIPGPRMLVAVHALGPAEVTATTPDTPTSGSVRAGHRRGNRHRRDQFRDAVRFQVNWTARNVIKVCATGGVLSLGDAVDTPQVTQAEMDAIVDEAHRLNKRTAAHAHGAAGAKVAIRAGIDSIEHGSFLDDEAVEDDEGARHVPGADADGGRVCRGQSQRPPGTPPEIAAKARAAVAARSGAFKRALDAGVRKSRSDTDSAVSPHGRNAQEFALLVSNGMTPAAAPHRVRVGGPLPGWRRQWGQSRSWEGCRHRRRSWRSLKDIA